MRAFIAIGLPKEIEDYLGKLEDKLKSTQADVKWVKPENIHLTLKFLGERDDKKVEQIKGALDEVSADNNAFRIHIGSLGGFPNLNSPRVIWVGIDQGESETKKIAQGLEEKIAKLGIPKEERPFSSHITIGRTRSNKNREKLVQELKLQMNEFGGQNLEFSVTKITLYKSTLTPTGPIYEILKEANLKTT